jgi:transcriptional regulator with XRE-family HTH domain
MVIGKRVKILREQKNMSQDDIQQRTGLLRCHISRVENGHTVPSVDTLERLAQALQIPMYRLFTDAEQEKKRTYRPRGLRAGRPTQNRNARFERSPNTFHARIIGSVNF